MIFFKADLLSSLIDSSLLTLILIPAIYVFFLRPLILAKRSLESALIDSQKFKIAVENASDHIIITDPEGVILYANKAVGIITGFEPDSLIGKKAGTLEAWGGQMPKEFYQELWKKIKDDKTVFRSEVTNRRKNGEKYTAQVSIAPILDRKGAIIFFVGIERDITREKQIDQAKTEFVSLASHQLGSPLTAIGWYTEMLLEGDVGKINDRQKKYLQEIYHGDQRMITLVKALLNVSRIELGTFAIDPKPIDFAEIAQELKKEMQSIIDQKQINFKENFDKSLPKINADPNLIRIVIQNLLSNAIKYTQPKGNVSIVISKKDQNIEIVVSDDGYGIPLSQKDKIFTKLFRADNVKKHDTEGTGLGLYIVKSIVDHGGGKIWFESEEDKGSKFIVQFPLSGMKTKEGTRALEEVK